MVVNRCVVLRITTVQDEMRKIKKVIGAISNQIHLETFRLRLGFDMINKMMS